MIYNFMVLADVEVSGTGYASRLLLICMPGVANDDVCHVAPQTSKLTPKPTLFGP